jgi:S-adenosylmethionine-dependent methyltransferase
MPKMIANAEKDRFQSGAEKYAAYLQTAEGKLRLDLAFANLMKFLPGPQVRGSLRALDIGCGTGALAVRLAELGVSVCALDSSEGMVDLARDAARRAGVVEKMELKLGDAVQITELFETGSFDVILCHNVLEYVEDPVAVLRIAGRMARDAMSILSVVVRNQTGEVLKAAIKEGDLGAAEHNLTAEWAVESLYGGSVRLFSAKALQELLTEASLVETARRGIRVISDYLPLRISLEAEYERILELELKLGSGPEFVPVARYIQCLARCAGVAEDHG